MDQGRGGQKRARYEPRDRREDRHAFPRDQARSRQGARCRRCGLQGLEEDARRHALQDAAQGRRHHPLARRRHREDHGAGAGQAAGGSQGRNAARGRHHGLVRRGSTPHVWPRHSCARREHLSACREGTGRPGCGVHAVEFPDQPGGSQSLGGDRRGMLDHPERSGGYAGLLRRTGEVLYRRRRSRRRPATRLRKSGGNFFLSHSAPRDPQDHVHGVDPGRQAACVARGPAHEANHHGAWRSCAGNRVRGCECRSGGESAVREQAPQRRAGLRGADALPRARKGLWRLRAEIHGLREEAESRRRHG